MLSLALVGVFTNKRMPGPEFVGHKTNEGENQGINYLMATPAKAENENLQPADFF
jgi:hypothetical protein